MGHFLDYELFQPSHSCERQIQEEVARYCREQRAKYLEGDQVPSQPQSPRPDPVTTSDPQTCPHAPTS